MNKRQIHPAFRHAAKAVKVVKAASSGGKQPRRSTLGRIVEALFEAWAR